MTVGALLLTAAGLFVAAGIVGVVAATRGIRLIPSRTRHPAGGGRRVRLTPLHLAALAAGIAMLLLTGWPVAALAAAAAVVFVPSVLGGGKVAKRIIVKSEAVADWTRRLADLISSGAAGSTRDALRRSLASVPSPIEAEVTRLVNRMGVRGIEPALRQFAREVDDPAADKIAGVLILRERNGGAGLAEVLTGLATDLDERTRMVREVEAERAKPRSNMRTIIGITAVLIIGLMLFSRAFLSSYSSVLGQLLLVLVVAVFAFALRWMRSLSNPPAAVHVLVEPDGVVDS